jgi:DNA polymerase IIIc chi subunit
MAHTQADFYILTNTNEQQRCQLACQIAACGFRQAHHVLLGYRQQRQSKTLNQKLWQAQGFLAHNDSSDCDHAWKAAPIVLHDMAQKLPTTEADWLINVSNLPVPKPQQFNYLVEIIDDADDELAHARNLYKQYRQLGFKLNHYKSPFEELTDG